MFSSFCSFFFHHVLLPFLSQTSDTFSDTPFPHHPAFFRPSEAEKANIRLHDLAVIRDPYVILGIVVLIIFVITAFKKMPQANVSAQQDKATNTVKRLWNNSVYREGVITQVSYVAAQIMVWTYIIHYADNLGINKATAQNFNILAMCLFLGGRFICTLGTITIVGNLGLYCLVGISAFMSLMFPTIYGIALENVDSQDTSLGAAFLVMAIVGGAIMPPLQGLIIDKQEILHHPAVNISFILPLLSFAIITLYGFRTYRKVAA